MKQKTAIGILLLTLVNGAAAEPRGAALDLVLVGHCDGMRLLVDPETRRVTGTRTGCEKGSVGGTAVPNDMGTTMMSGDTLVFVSDDGAFYWTVRDNGTFSVASHADGTLLNNGTWSTTKPAGATAPSSTPRRQALRPSPAPARRSAVLAVNR